MSGKVPPKTEVHITTAPAKAAAGAKKAVIPKKINCFVIEKPEKAGLVAVSTGKIEGDCFVIGWQEQKATWLVSDGAQWYNLAGNMMKANLAFTAVFAFCLLVAVIFTRGPRG